MVSETVIVELMEEESALPGDAALIVKLPT